MPRDRGRRRHRRADQMRAAPRALTALEIAVRGRSTALAGTEPVVVHAEAHRASRLSPLEARSGEDAIQTFALGLRLYRPRPWNDQRQLDVVGFAPATSSWRWSRSEEHTSELQSRRDLVCRLLLEKK